jgi:hypothetical protein
MIGHSLSLSDMLLVKGFSEAFGSDDKEKINKYLWDNGLDCSLGVDEVVCQHRNLQGKVVTCLRWEAHERDDPKWLKSIGCSWENTVNSCDLELRIALKTIGQQQDSTASIINHMQKHAN